MVELIDDFCIGLFLDGIAKTLLLLNSIQSEQFDETIVLIC
jgi:hypothetical protein